MPIRKPPLRETQGVKLIQVEDVSADETKVRSTHYRLTTRGPNHARVIAGEQFAVDAFDLEVIASSANPVVQRLIDAERH